MSIKSERKKRRIPVLCLIFILTAVLIHAVITPICSIVGTIVTNISYAIYLKTTFFMGSAPVFVLLVRTFVIIFSNNLNASFFSLLFLLIIAIMLLFKLKGGFVAIPAFLASLLTAISGTVSILYHVLIYAFSGLGNPLQNLLDQMITSIYDPSYILYWICLLLQLIIPIFWFMLGLSAIISIFSRNAKKKTFKILFGVPTVLFGILSGGVFVTAASTNILSALQELIHNIIALTVKSIALSEYHYVTFIFSGFTNSFFAPIFIFANILGLASIILLAVYLVNPYKRRKKQPADAAYTEEEISSITDTQAECAEGDIEADSATSTEAAESSENDTEATENTVS